MHKNCSTVKNVREGWSTEIKIGSQKKDYKKNY